MQTYLWSFGRKFLEGKTSQNAVISIFTSSLLFFSDNFCKNIVKEGSGRGMVRKEETGKKDLGCSCMTCSDGIFLLLSFLYSSNKLYQLFL